MAPAKKQNRGSDWKAHCQRTRVITNYSAKLKRSLAKIPGKVRNAVRDNKVDSLEDNDDQFQIDRDNFIEPWRTLVMVEHYYQLIEARKYDQFDVELEMIPSRYRSSAPHVRLRGVSKKLTSLERTDLVVLENVEEFITHKVSDFKDDLVELRYKFSAKFSGKYNISFVPSVKSYQRIYQALDMITNKRRQPWQISVRDVLFDSPQGTSDDPQVDEDSSDKEPDIEPKYKTILEERLSKCSESQQRAINGVWEAKCRPKPYIVMGPPGSGKSSAIVEMVVRLFHRRPYLDFILVCASSEESADRLARAIYETKLVDSVARMCLNGYRAETGCSESLIREQSLYCKDHIKGLMYRVLVATINTAGVLHDKIDFFNYVIIDDACNAYEPEILIPLNYMMAKGCLVLVGDPEQLGPVVHCRQAEMFGLGQSTLERLLGLDYYIRHPDRGYDENYITELQGSNRCDPRVLAPCNKLFYNDTVECLGQTPEGLLKMLNLNYPLVFKPIVGCEEENSGAISRCNPLEADECVAMVIKLLKIGLKAKQIGVVTFYSYQAQEIEDKLKASLKKYLPAIFEARKELPKDLDYVQNDTTESSDDTELGAHLEKTTNQEGGDPVITGDDLRSRRLEASFRRWLCKVDIVDKFQGDDREVIITSTVRCPEQSSDSIKNCEELSDSRRFNVAMSRAKWLTMVVGHPAVLNLDDNWREFKKHAAQLD